MQGESVANLADILGTIFGIVLSKMKTATLPTFAFLSAGYLVASRMEVDSVELPYMNRARLAYSAAKYLTHGSVPSVAEANHNEPLLPWGNHNQQRIELGACVDEACASGPEDLRFAAGLFKDQRYLITYRPDTGKVCVVLREGATSQDCLKASLTAHLFLHLHDGKPLACGLPGSATHGSHPPTHAFNLGVGSKGGKDQGHQQQAASPAASSGGSGGPFSGLHFTNPFGSKPKAGAVDDVSWRTLMSRTRGLVDGMHNDFVQQAEKRGWNLKQTMLNPKEVRVLRLKVTPLHV